MNPKVLLLLRYDSVTMRVYLEVLFGVFFFTRYQLQLVFKHECMLSQVILK